MSSLQHKRNAVPVTKDSELNNNSTLNILTLGRISLKCLPWVDLLDSLCQPKLKFHGGTEGTKWR